MRRAAVAAVALVLAASVTACSERPACPGLSSNPDGSYTIEKPTNKDVDGCEYEFDGQDLTTERDTD